MVWEVKMGSTKCSLAAELISKHSGKAHITELHDGTRTHAHESPSLFIEYPNQTAPSGFIGICGGLCHPPYFCPHTEVCLEMGASCLSSLELPFAIPKGVQQKGRPPVTVEKVIFFWIANVWREPR